MPYPVITPSPAAEALSNPGVERERFYFVHSYGVRTGPAVPGEPGQIVPVETWTTHDGDRFVAAIEAGALSTTQFHPEKSGPAGARLLRSWLATL